jgi:MOSC domain-containing protein YiiM
MVRKLDIDGDAQADLAGHGGEHRTIFVYQMDSYVIGVRAVPHDHAGHALLCREIVHGVPPRALPAQA